jgi:hypothetical protein
MTRTCTVVLVGVLSAGTALGAQSDCRVTLNDPSSDSYQNEFLRTGLWPEGTVVFKPGGPGFIARDGGLSMKFGWWRHVPGALTISGRRLDGQAPALRARIPSGYEDRGFQATAIVFPTPGCWEVTGHLAGGSLTFVTRVLKIGDGPSGRADW